MTDTSFPICARWSDRGASFLSVKVPDGMVFVDIDDKGGASGWVTLGDLGLDLPPTCAYDSQGMNPGKHYGYLTEQPVATANAFRPGIDLRGPNNTLRMRVEREAEWLETLRTGTYAEAPAWVYEEADLTKRAGAARKQGLAVGWSDNWIADADGVVHDGDGRHAFLVSMAARLRARGFEPDELKAQLAAVNERQVSPPKGDREVEAIANSVRNYAVDPSLAFLGDLMKAVL